MSDIGGRAGEPDLDAGLDVPKKLLLSMIGVFGWVWIVRYSILGIDIALGAARGRCAMSRPFSTSISSSESSDNDTEFDVDDSDIALPATFVAEYCLKSEGTILTRRCSVDRPLNETDPALFRAARRLRKRPLLA